MSTNFVHVVPRDPFFVPASEVEGQARRWFGQAMPGGWEVTSTVIAPMGFIHAVEAGDDIHCPACGAQLDWQWVWSLLPDPPPVVVAPCCGRGVRLVELLAGVEAILGVALGSVFQRI